MKAVIMILLMSLGLGTSAQNVSRIAGVWESADGGGIEVIDSSHMFITFGKNKKELKSCQFNFSAQPNTFDFTVADSSGDMALQSLFIFVNDDLIQWQVFDQGKRPQNFDPAKGEVLFLRRKKL